MQEIIKSTVLVMTLLGITGQVAATGYSYELSESQTWSDGGSLNSETQYVTVRAYVPGSRRTSYKTISIYTSTYTSDTNSLGDTVGSVFQIYGSGNTAFADPYDAPKKTVIYPATQILSTRLLAVNDDRLALGNYHVLGGHAAGKGFIYDIIYDQYTSISAPDTEWTDAADINNAGQIVGARINADGALRTGFIYDCVNGFQPFEIPGASWTVPKKIDDEGNIYGTVSGLGSEIYFIARPDSLPVPDGCSLVPRDDVADPVIFANSTSFEMSGDRALGIRIGDYDGNGVNDIFIYHEPGKSILYLGENGFKSKVKYFGDHFNTLTPVAEVPDEWDFNNDGLIDKLVTDGRSLVALHIARDDGSFFYVPQYLPAGSRFADLNGDGRVDYLTVSGASVSVVFQTGQASADSLPAADPVTEPVGEPVAPDSSMTPIDTSNAMQVDANAYKVESRDTIAAVGENNVLLTSGKVLWFNSDSIIKYNDASSFEAGQTLEFKAWLNPDGSLVGIKVEVVF